jgi:hypothetical protein
MSSAGRAVSSNGCVTKPKGHEIGLTGFAVQIQPASLIGSYAMATAEHREPYESRVHVRFWERPEVKALRATRQSRRFGRRRLLPVFPDKQTSRTETGTSEKCHKRMSSPNRSSVDAAMRTNDLSRRECALW